jgi:hypothetical protein
VKTRTLLASVAILAFGAPFPFVRAGAPGAQEAQPPAWSDPSLAIATDAGGVVTVGEALLGRTIRGDESDPTAIFATMLVKHLRTRLVDQTLAGGESECPADQIEALSFLIAEFRNTPTKAARAAMEEEALLLRQILADRAAGRKEWPTPDPEDRTAQRAAHLRATLPTDDAVRSRLQTIETSKPEVAFFGEDARTLCRRIRAAEKLSGGPVVATREDLDRMREDALRDHTATGRTSPVMLPRSAELRIRVDKADKIVRAEVLRRLQEGEITLARPELLEAARAAADPLNQIGWL